MIGTSIGNITIQGILGQGGMGAVYRGFDTRLHRTVAVKAIHKRNSMSGEYKARFLKEARILSNLDHPNICRVYDYIEGDEADYLVLELVEGRTLREEMGEMDERRKLAVALDMARALHAAHTKGIVHRDLKPDNIMVTAEGAKVLDFGIARSIYDSPNPLAPVVTSATTEQCAEKTVVDQTAETHISVKVHVAEDTEVFASALQQDKLTERLAKLTQAGSIIGTVRYMSPEQARGEQVGTASDLYSFGVILQEVFTGKEFYPNLPARDILIRVARGESGPPWGLDDELTDLINKLKSHHPLTRPDTDEVVAALEALCQRPQRRARKRRRLLVGTLLSCLFLVAVFTTWQLSRRAPSLPVDSSKRLVLLPFVNQTGVAGNDVLARGLTRLVNISLDLSEEVETVASDEVASGLVGLGLKAATLTESQELELMKRLGGNLCVRAEISRGKSDYTLTWQLLQPDGSKQKGKLDAATLEQASERLLLRLSEIMRPAAAPLSLADRFAAKPSLNRTLALGLEHGRQLDDKALSYFEVCLNEAPEFHRARLEMAGLLVGLGRLDEAELALLTVLKKLGTSGDKTVTAQAQLWLARLEIKRANYPQAVPFAEAAHRDFESYGSKRGMAEANDVLACSAKGLLYYEQAEVLWQRALVLARETAGASLEGGFLEALGRLRVQEGNQPGAVEMFNQAIARYGEAGLQGMQAGPLLELGQLALQNGDTVAADDHFQKALTSYRQVGEWIGQAHCFWLLALSAKAQEQWERSLAYLRQALSLVRNPEDQLFKAEILGMLVIGESRSGAFPDAIRHLDELRIIAEGLNTREILEEVSYAQAYLLLQQGDLAAVKSLLSKTPERRRWLMLKAKRLYLQGKLKKARKQALAGMAINDVEDPDHAKILATMEKAVAKGKKLPLPDSSPASNPR